MLGGKQTSGKNLLFWRVVNALDINLEESIISGDLSPETLSSCLINCALCPNARTCRDDLDAQGDHLMAAPRYCPVNRTLAHMFVTHSHHAADTPQDPSAASPHRLS